MIRNGTSAESSVPPFVECKCNEKVRLVHLVDEGISKRYLAVPIREGTGIENRDFSGSIITLRDQHGLHHVAFEDKQWRGNHQDNVEVLEAILESLAHHQAENLVTTPIEIPTYEIKDYLEVVVSKYHVNVSNNDQIAAALAYNEAQLKRCVEQGPLVNSVGFPGHYPLKDHRNIVLYTLVPPVYDALLYIMALSDENLRKYHFPRLMRYYFGKLVNFLGKIDRTRITREYMEATVRTLLPAVKLQLVLHSSPSKDLLRNTMYWLKHPLINQEDVYEILQSAFGTGFDLVEYRMETMEVTSGHMGSYHRLIVVGEVDGTKKVLKLFLKLLQPVNKIMENVVKGGLGETEDFFYGVLLGLYRTHGLEELVDFAPRCYLSRVNWMLVLKDVLSEGYSTIPVNGELDIGSLRAVLATLAKFAAATLILEEKLSRERNERVQMVDLYPREFAETVLVYNEGHKLKKVFEASKDGLHYLLELCREVTVRSGLTTEETIRRVDAMFMSVFEKTRPSSLYRNAASHGDLHLGNILLRRPNVGSADEAVLVDFQVLRYLPPAFDPLFVIALSTNRSTRSKYREVLMEEYYRQVRGHLEAYGCDPERIFPEESFRESVDYMKSAALSLTLIYSQFIKPSTLVREETFNNPDKFTRYIATNRRAFINMLWSDERYKRIMTEYIMDVIDYITEVF